MPAKLNFFKTPTSVRLVQVGPCPLPLEYQAATSHTGRQPCRVKSLYMKRFWSVATLPPFGPIEGQKWFDHISSQLESQKNWFALIYFGKNQFLPPCVWNIPFMSYRLSGTIITWAVAKCQNALLIFWLRTRVSSKQTKIDFGLNRNKPKQDLFCVCFGLFRETKN